MKKEKIEKNNNKMNNKLKIVLIVSSILFLVISILIFTGIITSLDDTVSSYIIGIRNNKLTKHMINITNIGGGYCLICISLLLLIIFFKKRRYPILIIINLVLVFLSSRILKLIFRRSRPDGLFLVNETGYSYPSGHVMVSFAYILFIIYLIWKYIKNKTLKIVLSVILIIITLLISFSRIYLGVHYFSDIIGSIFIALAYLSLFISFVNNKGYLK